MQNRNIITPFQDEPVESESRSVPQILRIKRKLEEDPLDTLIMNSKKIRSIFKLAAASKEESFDVKKALIDHSITSPTIINTDKWNQTIHHAQRDGILCKMESMKDSGILNQSIDAMNISEPDSKYVYDIYIYDQYGVISGDEKVGALIWDKNSDSDNDYNPESDFVNDFEDEDSNDENYFNKEYPDEDDAYLQDFLDSENERSSESDFERDW